MKKRLFNLVILFLITFACYFFPFKQDIIVKAAEMALNQTKVTLGVDETTKLDITGTKKMIIWTSSNKKIATVNSKGKVKAIKKGNCNIMAKVASKTYKCSIKVVAKYNKKDLAALKAIFAEQKKQRNDFPWIRNVSWSKKIPSSSDFTWKAGRLVGINWAGKTNSDSGGYYTIPTMQELCGSVSFSGLTALQKVNCYRGYLTNIDVSGCKELVKLNCYDNNLTDINVSNCTKLKYLNISSNEIDNLDISNCTNLEILNVSKTALADLDIRNCTKLIKLYCHNAKLTKLDISNCSNLKELQCHENNIENLDISNCINLEFLSCSHNSISKLDVGNCPKLDYLSCENNNISEIDISNCPKFDESFSSLYCDNCVNIIK